MRPFDSWPSLVGKSLRNSFQATSEQESSGVFLNLFQQSLLLLSQPSGSSQPGGTEERLSRTCVLCPWTIADLWKVWSLLA